MTLQTPSPTHGRGHAARFDNLTEKVCSSLGALSRESKELMIAGVRQSFYHSLAWYQNLVEHALDPGDETRIYSLEKRGVGALAALPLRLAAKPIGRWRSRGLTSLSNYYSSLWGPVLTGPEDDAAASIRELVAAVCGDGSLWDFVQLGPLSKEGPLFEQLVDAFRRNGTIVQPYFRFGNWYLEVAGRTSEQYFGSLPSVLRNTINRKAKKLSTSRDARIQIVTGGSDLERAVTDYERIYSVSWKIPEPYPEFVSGLIRTCARMGWLRLGLLYIADQPVAAQLWIVTGKSAVIFKLAYDEKYAPLSPGTVLTAHLMRHAIDVDGVEVVDFGTGDDPYKKDWMSHRRERWGILALNPRTVRGGLGIVEHLGGRLLKKLVGRGDRRRESERSAAGTGQA